MIINLLRFVARFSLGNQRRQNVSIFAVNNLKYDSKIQLTTAITKYFKNKIFETYLRDRHKTRIDTQMILLKEVSFFF